MSRARAFTLVELLIALVVSGILVSISVRIYGVTRTALQQDQAKADLSQNARIVLGRLSRELRQTPDIVTILPANQSDNSIAQPGYIEFQDGHANDLTYKRYYLNGTVLEQDTKEYYFSSAPGTRVRWDATSNGATPTASVISTQDIADNIQSISFYGNDSSVQMVIISSDGANQRFTLQGTVQERN